MKFECLKRLKKICISSLVSMIFYIITYPLSSAMMNESRFMPKIGLIFYSLVFMAFFSWFLIYISYIRNELGMDIAEKEYSEGYLGLKTDLKLIWQREKITIFMIFAINIVSWILISLDKMVFGRRTITAIMLVFAPLNIIGVVLPSWINGILSYVVGGIIISAIYLLELVILRRKWYKKIKGYKNGKVQT